MSSDTCPYRPACPGCPRFGEGGLAPAATAALEAVAAAATSAANPIDDKRGTIEYRKQVAGVITRRAAKIAHERAKGNA